jgi:hypothetical protein
MGANPALDTLRRRVEAAGGELVTDTIPVSGQHVDARRAVPTVIVSLDGETQYVQAPSFTLAAARMLTALWPDERTEP